jgi:outer membrane lipoprotein-sorting protein
MLTVAIFLSVMPSVPPSTNEAERLLADMDAKITAAKTIRIQFTIDDSNVDTKQRLADGTLVVSTGNRFRYDLTGTMSARVVSDGMHLVSIFAKPEEKKSQLAPVWFNEVLKAWLGRGGTFISCGKVLEYASASVGEQPSDKGGPKTSKARMLPEEVVNGIKARVVEYDLAFPKMLGDIDAAKVRVWIDPKTKLPIRRTMTFKFGSEDKTYAAIHTKFEIDPKLEDKLFELPK